MSHLIDSLLLCDFIIANIVFRPLSDLTTIENTLNSLEITTFYSYEKLLVRTSNSELFELENSSIVTRLLPAIVLSFVSMISIQY